MYTLYLRTMRFVPLSSPVKCTGDDSGTNLIILGVGLKPFDALGTEKK